MLIKFIDCRGVRFSRGLGIEYRVTESPVTSVVAISSVAMTRWHQQRLRNGFGIYALTPMRMIKSFLCGELVTNRYDVSTSYRVMIASSFF